MIRFFMRKNAPSPFFVCVGWITIILQFFVPLFVAVVPTPIDAASVSSFSKTEVSATSVNPDPNNTGDAADFLLGKAASGVSSEAEAWLNQFGTARLRLNANKDFDFGGSEFDMLLPLREGSDSLLFTQFGARYKNDRYTANVGLGARYFSDSWMYGLNTFYDYDISGRNSRLGLGAEAWTDYLKLSANGYLGLSDWRQSRDFEDFRERPASGYDLAVDAYLPFLPQLGTKLKYEQYFGDDVALFGSRNRQKDPYALTFGLNYTPFPLLTLDADYKKGKGSKDDFRVSLGLNYRFGVPWSSQIDPGSVKTSRLVSGMRYDLVERNNDIVLDYRKKELIHITLAEVVQGYTGEQKSLDVSVTGRYPLQSIEWHAAALEANNGQIIQDRGQSPEKGYSLVFPDYQYEGAKANSYTISAVAVDTQGNRSEPAYARVIVTHARLHAGNTILTPQDIVLPADGKSTETLVLHIRDKHNQPVDIPEEEIVLALEATTFSADTPDTMRLHVTSFTRQGVGEYVSTVTAGSRPMEATVLVSAREETFPSATVRIVADTATSVVSSLEVQTDNAIADGVAENRIRAVVTDAMGHRVPLQTVNFSAGNGATIDATAQSDDNGEVTLPVTSVVAGTSLVKASVGQEKPAETSLTFVANPATAVITVENLEIIPEIAIANGIEEKTVQAIVTDAHGNRVPGIDVAFSARNGGTISKASVPTDENGVVRVTLTHTVAGIETVTATVNGTPISKDTLFIADSATRKVTDVIPSEGPYIADGTTAVTFSATVNDGQGNPVPGVVVDWGSDRDSQIVKFTSIQSTTNERGVAQTRITSTAAFAVKVTASVGTSSLSAAPITFRADPAHGRIVALESDKPQIVADGADTALLTLKAEDAFGNALPGVPVSWDASNGSTIVAAGQTTDGQGTLSATLTTTVAGVVTTTAKLDNGATRTVTLNAVADATTVQFASVEVIPPRTVPADGVSSVTIRARVEDAQGNTTLPGVSVEWKSTLGQLSAPSSTTNDRGEAEITVSSTVAGQAQVMALLSGGVSQAADDTVEFTPGAFDGDRSTLSVSPSSLVANGVDQATVQVTARDGHDNLLPGLASTITVKYAPDLSVTQQGGFTEVSPGVYETRISGTKAGQTTVSAASGTTSVSQTASLTLQADATTVQFASVEVIPPRTVPADGVSSVTVRARVEDAQGNTTLPGVSVEWKSTLGQLSAPSSTTNDRGEAEITVSSTVAGQAQVMALLSGGVSQAADDTVEFTPGAFDGDRSTLSVSPSSLVANGVDQATVQVTARDGHDNLLPGLASTITVKYAPDLSVTQQGGFTEVSPGVYETRISGTKAGQTTVSAASGTTSVSQTASLTLQADATTVQFASVEVIPPRTVPADGVSSVTIRARVEDAQGNTTLPGVSVEWKSTLGQLSAPSSTTNDRGEAEITVSSTVAGQAQVMALLSGGVSQAADDTVEFTPGAFDGDRSTLSVSPSSLVANGVDQATVQVTARDGHDNLLPGLASTITVKYAPDLSVTQQGGFTEVSPGVYETRISGTKAGQTTVSAASGTTSVSQTASLTLQADATTVQFASVEVIPPRTVPADGVSSVTVRARVEDAQGNTTLPGVSVEWKSTLGQLSAPSSTTNDRGEAEITVSSTVAGQAQVMALLSGGVSQAADDTVEFTPGAFDGDRSTLSVSPSSLVANGVDQATVQVTARDGHDNLLPGLASTITVKYAPDLSVTQQGGFTEVSPGVYETRISGTKAGQTTVSAASGTTSVSQTASLTLQADATTVQFASVEVIPPRTVPADGVSSVTIRARVEDAQGNTTLPGVSVEWKSTLGQLSAPSSTTNDRGEAEITVSSTVAGQAQVMALLSGGVSQAADDTVEFTPGAFDGDRSTLSVSPSSLVANGVDQATVQVTARDGHDNLLPGLASTITVKYAPDLSVTQQGGFTEVSPGVYETRISGTKAGQTTVSAASGTTSVSQTAPLILQADATTATVRDGEITVLPRSTIVGQKVTYSATLVDAHGNSLGRGISVTWDSNAGSDLEERVTLSDEKGQVSVSLSRQQVGVAKTTLTVSGKGFEAPDAVFEAGEVEISTSSLSLEPTVIVADGKDMARLTLTLRDRYDNPLSGQRVKGTSDMATVQLSDAREESAGVYVIEARGTQVGIATLGVEVNGKPFKLSARLGLIAGQTTVQFASVKVIPPRTVPADGVSSVTIRAQVKDAQGNTALPGIPVGWNSTLGHLSVPLSITNDQGEAEVTLSSPRVGQAQVTASLARDVSQKADDTIEFTSGAFDADRSTLSVSPSSLVANGVDQATVRVVARDGRGILLPGLASTITVKYAPDLSVTQQGGFTEVSPGVYETRISGTKVGQTTVSAASGTTQISQTAPLTLRADLMTATVRDGKITVQPKRTGVGQKVTYSATLVDAHGNSLGQGISVTWVSNAGSDLEEFVTLSDENSQVNVSLSRRQAGVAKTTLTVSGKGFEAPDAVFEAGEVEISTSSLSLEPTVIVADGKDMARLTLTLRDRYDNPLSGQRVKGTSDMATVQLSDAREESAGVYVIEARGTQVGIATLGVEVNGKPFKLSAQLGLRAGQMQFASVKVIPPRTVPADGVASVTIRAKVKDAQGGVSVEWKSTLGQLSVPLSITNDRGEAEVTLSSTAAGQAQVTASLAGGVSQKADNTIEFTSGAFDADRSTLSVSPSSLVANGVAQATVRVVARDDRGFPLPGLASTITVKYAPDLSVTQQGGFTEVSPGVYETRISGTKAGQTTVSAASGTTSVSQTAPLTLRADVTTATVRDGEITVLPRSTIVGQKVTYSATLVDAHGNRLKGMPVLWDSNAGSDLEEFFTLSDENGQVSVSLSRQQAGVAKTTLTVSGKGFEAPDAVFEAGEVEISTSFLSLKPTVIVADGKDMARLTLTLRDRYDNPLSGQRVKGTSDMATVQLSDAREESAGVYVIEARGTQVGIATLGVEVNGKPFKLSAQLGLRAGQMQFASVKVIPPRTVPADGVASVTIRAKVKDAQGGVSVEWKSTLGQLSVPLSITNDRGEAEVTLSSTAAGQAQVTASLAGGVSQKADNTIEFTSGAFDGDRSTLSVSPSSLVANGVDQATVRMVARDDRGFPLPGLASTITVKYAPDLSVTQQGGFTEVSPGVYETRISGTKAGQTTVSAASGTTSVSQTAPLILQADATTATVRDGEITVLPRSTIVGQKVTYSATLVDAHGNSLGRGISVTWDSNAGSDLEERVTLSDEKGQVSVSLSRQQVGVAKTTLTVSGKGFEAPDAVFEAGEVEISTSSLSLEPTVIVADGKDMARLTLTLRDRYDNPLSGQRVKGTSDMATVQLSDAREESAGVYVIEARGTQVGIATLGVEVNGKPFKLSARLGLKADPATVRFASVEVVPPASVPADGVSSVTIRAKVKDAQGNTTLPGISVGWNSTLGHLSVPFSTTNDRGEAEVTLSSTVAGQARVTARLAGGFSQAADDTIEFIPSAFLTRTGPP